MTLNVARIKNSNSQLYDMNPYDNEYVEMASSNLKSISQSINLYDSNVVSSVASSVSERLEYLTFFEIGLLIWRSVDWLPMLYHLH